MPKKNIIKPAKSAPAVGPYNHAVRIGDLLFCAGQIPIDPATGNLVAGDIKAQAERVLQNVKAILDDQNLTFAQPYGCVQRGESAEANRNGRHRRPRAKHPVLFLKDGGKIGSHQLEDSKRQGIGNRGTSEEVKK